MTSETINIRGIASLCFVPSDSRFYGNLISCLDNKSYSVLGKLAKTPDTYTNTCCYEEPPIQYDIYVTRPGVDNMDDVVISIRNVIRTGGDNCHLNSSEFDFITDKLLADARAEDYITKYLSLDLLGKNCYICLGDVTIDIPS